MTATVGSMVAELSANTASFQKDMGKAAQILNSHAADMNRTLSFLEKKFTGIGKGLVAGFTVGAIANFSKEIIDNGDHLSKLSERTGVSVEKLSEFAYGAKLAGVSTDDLATGLKKLAVNMADAAANGGGQMAETFRALGISVTDSNGKLRDVGNVFEELSAKSASFDDDAGKTAIQVRLLGKSGDALTPLMNHLSETSAAARKLGVTTSTDFAKSSEIFNDTISKMGEKVAALGRDALLPVIKLFNALHEDRSGINLENDVKRIEESISKVKKRMEEISAGGSITDQLFPVDSKALTNLESQLATAKDRLEKFRASQTTVLEGPKTIAPIIDEPGQIASFKRLMDELEKATSEANAAMTLDDQQRSDERLAIAAKEFENKAELAHLSVSRRMEFEEKFMTYQKAAAERAAFDLRSPLQKLSEEWEDTTKQMKNATVNWANHAAESLTDLVMTGKASFGDFANAIIRDLIRIGIQRQLAGLFGLFGASSTSTAGAGLLGSSFGAAAGFATGGDPPVGKPYWVGENGPELRIDRTPSTIIPGNMLGGKVGTVYNIDARGADRTGLDRLEQLIRQLDGSIEHRAVAAAANNRARGGVLAL